MLDFENYFKKFKNEIKNEYFRNASTLDVDNKEIFKLALNLGYRDAQRTFIKINEKVWSKDGAKDKFYNKFSVELQKLFKNKTFFSPEPLFDDFIKFFQSRGYAVTYGQAQKVINMAFKYLYCLDTKKEYKHIFDKCHIPLDSFTLAWYKRNILRRTDDKKYQIKSDDSWSKLSREKYTNIQELINSRVSKGLKIKINGNDLPLPKIPLEFEFIIWQEEIMNQAVANFNKTIYKSINEIYNATDDYRMMLKDTDKYIKQLKE